MRKNINKIVAFAIGISIMSGSIMPAFATDTTQNDSTANVQTNNIQANTNQKAVLTLDEAIKSAISNSETLALDEINISYIDKTNDIKEDQDDFNNVKDDVDDYHKDTADVNLKKAQQQRDFDQDLLTQTVTKKYNDIVTNQMKINNAAKDLEVKSKQLEDMKLRQSLGIKTAIDLKSAQLDIEKLQNSQESSENALKDLQYSFKVLTGKDLAQYSLEQDVNFEPLKIDGSIDEYLDNTIDSYLKYSEQLLKLNKDYYNDSDNKITAADVDDAKNISDNAVKPTFDPVNDTVETYTNKNNKYQADKNAYTNAVSARLAYLGNKLSIDKDQTSLNKNKKDYKDQLKTCYTNLRTSEDKINAYKKNIEIVNEKLSNYKLQYDLGMITETIYNGYVVSSMQDDIDLRNEVINYNNLKEKLQKPWIV
jgi:hypothetical protein